MTFDEAIEFLPFGNRITREVYSPETFIMASKLENIEGFSSESFMPSQEDILAEDWMVLPSFNSLHFSGEVNETDNFGGYVWFSEPFSLPVFILSLKGKTETNIAHLHGQIQKWTATGWKGEMINPLDFEVPVDSLSIYRFALSGSYPFSFILRTSQ